MCFGYVLGLQSENIFSFGLSREFGFGVIGVWCVLDLVFERVGVGLQQVPTGLRSERMFVVLG